jgi:hypothetical protein
VPHPSVRGVTCALGKSFATTPDGKVYSYMESPSPEYLVKRGIMASFSPTEIKNYEVQGEGGEWAKAALWLAIREFYRQRNFGGLGLLVNQVHDATYADAHKDVALEVAATLHACMEGASDLMEWYFDWQLQLPVPSDTTWGASMMDDDSIPGVKERAAAIRQGAARPLHGRLRAVLHLRKLMAFKNLAANIAQGRLRRRGPDRRPAGRRRCRAAGPCNLRLVGYIETGKHAKSFNGAAPKDKEQVTLLFEVSGKNHPPIETEDGPRPHIITINETLSLNEKARYFKLFQLLNYKGVAKHAAELAAECAAYRGRILHREYTDTRGQKRIAAELYDKAVGMRGRSRRRASR